MNGLGNTPHEENPLQWTARQLRDRLALIEACEPIQQAHHEAKQAYQEAMAAGNPRVIAAAKQARDMAASRLNETRRWLRAEARLAHLLTFLASARPEGERLAAEQEIGGLETLLAPYREAFAARPALPAGPGRAGGAGSAEVDMPAVRVRAKGGN